MRRGKPTTERVEIPDDLNEAREMREQAHADHQEASSKFPAISKLTTYLTERRNLNHFGDSIQITFTRRTSG